MIEMKIELIGGLKSESGLARRKQLRRRANATILCKVRHKTGDVDDNITN